MKRLLAVVCLLLGPAFAEPPKELHLEVNSSSLPMTRPNEQQPAPAASPGKLELPAVQGNSLTRGEMRKQRKIPWQYGPEYPTGPGRAYPTTGFPGLPAPNTGPGRTGPYW